MFSKLEFAVQISSLSCCDKIKKQLVDCGISKSDIQISYESGTVFVNTNLPSSLILNSIEKTGAKAILKGYGSTTHENLGAAVAMIGGPTGYSELGINGVIRFVQINENECVIDGTIDGLSPGKHGIHVYDCGDLSNGCKYIGDHLNLNKTSHGNQTDDENHRHTGDLGNITANDKGRAMFYFKDRIVNISHLIGRSIGITEQEDDCGMTKIQTSKIDGNSGKVIACGIIARSSGLFENSKTICTCDGVTLWEERDVPLVGPGRQKK